MSETLKILGLKQNQANNFKQVKAAYTKTIREVCKNKDKRIKVNLAYEQLCHKIFNSKNDDQIYYNVLRGEIAMIKYRIQMNKKMINYVSQGGYPLIYIAVRSGHQDIVQLLLKWGCDLDFSKYSSTPMHCAAYYGHIYLIPLLLKYGIPITIKNKFESLPVEQSATTQITQLLKKAQQDQIQTLTQKLVNEKYCLKLLNIYQDGQLVIKKLIYKNYFRDYSQYIDTFHGTHINNFQSIAKNGLKKVGDIVDGKKLTIVSGHIDERIKVKEIKDWGQAIFTSPSIFYAAHPVYSKQFITNSQQTWSPVVQLKVRKGCYTEHQHTLCKYGFKNGQPETVQYRSEDDLDQTMDMSQNEEPMFNVEVVGFLFIKKGFLDDCEDFSQTTQMIINSVDEKKYRAMCK